MKSVKTSALLALAGIAALSLVFAACGDDDDEGNGGATATTTQDGGEPAGEDAVTIQIQDNSFPAETRVAVGGTVTWDWAGSSNPHSVVGTSDNAVDLINSETMTGEGTYEVTFDEAGTYEYQCGVHGAAMSGRIVVG